MAENPYARWAPQPAAAPGGPITIGTPDPMGPLDQTYRQGQIAAQSRDAATAPYDAKKAEADARRAVAEAAKAEREAAAGVALGDDAQKAAGKRATLDSIIDQVNRVQQLYNSNLRDEAYGVFSSLADYLPTDENAQFDVAGQGLADQGLAAFRVPGVGAQSDLEARQFAKANTPQASDRDLAIEEKLLNLRGRIDANRAALGLPPAKWLSSGEAASPDDAAITPPGAAPFPGGTAPPGGGDDPTQSRPVNEIPTGPGAPPVGFEQGYEDDPQLAGVKAEYQRRLGRGDRGGDILAWLRSVGVSSPAVTQSVMRQIEFRQKHPNVPIENYNVEAIDDRVIPQSATRALTNVAADTNIGTAIMNAGNTISGNNYDSLTGTPELTRLGIEAANAKRPGSALTGQILGGAGLALTAEAGLARAGLQNALARTLAADIGTGAFQGAGANDENRLAGAALGAAAGAAGNRLGAGAQKAIGATIGGVVTPAVRALREQNIPLTLGQTVGQSGTAGKIVKGIEDRLAGAPVIGDLINARRTEGVRAFNSKAFDRALKPINGNVGDAVGEQAVLAAQRQVSDAYTQALGGKSVGIDRDFVPDMTPALQSVRDIPRIGDEINNSIDDVTRPYFDANGRLSGENFQALMGDLQAIKSGYRGDPLSHRVNKAVSEVEKAFENLFKRQAPEVMPAYGNAKRAYRQLSVIADSVNRAKNAEGIFTPAQLGLADRANSIRFDGRQNAAAGKSPFHDFQRDAQDVLPNNIPDSGTAGRVATLLAPGAIVGSGAGAGYAADGSAEGAAGGASTGLGLAALLALAYTKGGQAALRGAMARRGDAARAAGKAIEDRSRFTGRLGASGLNALAVQR